jgi:hypothetical protein
VIVSRELCEQGPAFYPVPHLFMGLTSHPRHLRAEGGQVQAALAAQDTYYFREAGGQPLGLEGESRHESFLPLFELES